MQGNQLPEETRNLIQGFLVTPTASRRYLLREMGLALLQNLLACYMYVYLLHYYGVWECSPFIGAWFSAYGCSNFCAVLCKLMFLPQLAILRPPVERARKIEYVRKLKRVLGTRLYVQNTYLSQFLIFLYLVGSLILGGSYLFTLIQNDECHERNPTRQVGSLLCLVFAFKFYFTVKNSQDIEQQKVIESQQQFLLPIQFDRIDMDRQSTCSICLNEFAAEDTIAEYQCPGLHLFHTKCITDWLSSSSNTYKRCPYCIQVPPEYD